MNCCNYHCNYYSKSKVTEARKFARTKNAPQRMKNIWIKLRKIEEEYSEFCKEHREWKKSIKDILIKNEKLRKKRWSYIDRIRGLKARLVMYYPSPKRLIIIEKRIKNEE
jgi:chromosome segregation ATPase